MTSLKSTLAISATIDDRRRSGPELTPAEALVLAEHRKLDSLLRAANVARVVPPADLASRIAARLESVPHRRETVLAVLFRSPGRMAALAAACLAFGLCMWILVPVLRPPAERLASSNFSGLDPSVVFGLPERSEPAIKASIDNPYMQEAASLKNDTVRAADMVLAHLPIGYR